MARLATLGSVLALWLLAAVPAGAQEITDYIDKQADAAYSGDQTIVCVTPDGNVSQVSHVDQVAGVRVTHVENGGSVVSEIGSQDPHPLADRYEVTPARPGTFLNRAVIRYNVLDAGQVRMALTFDAETGALLESETFNADGSLYCRNRLVTFQDTAPSLDSGAVPVAPVGVPVLEVDAQTDQLLPDQIASFTRLAVYEWPDEEIATGHYSDGLFTMTIFVSERSIEVPELADREPVELPTGLYQRSFSVGQVVYAWRAEQGGYVLVGDLTLDQQVAVLDELPSPERLGFLGRLWRSIFRR